jgi:hypothetical protein
MQSSRRAAVVRAAGNKREGDSVLLVISSSIGLTAAYGAQNADMLRNALAQISVSIPGARSLLLRSQPDAAQLYAELKASLGRQQITASHLNEGILILGDQRVFPSFIVANPVADREVDPDTTVLTDNPFGQFDWQSPADAMLPPTAVGRLAAGVDQPAFALKSLLDAVVNRHSQPALRAGYVEVTTRQWQNASASVLSAIAPSAKVFVSPDQRIDARNASALNCKYLYCNLHGFLNSAPWYGYDNSLSSMTPALTPDAFQPAYVSGTIAFSEACYGLATAGKRTSASNALSLLASGAASVVGATGLAYGTADPRGQTLVDADVMARTFFNTILSGGISVGNALTTARQALRGTGAGGDSFLQKTLLEFQILGDPSHVPA